MSTAHDLDTPRSGPHPMTAFGRSALPATGAHS